MMQFIYRSLFLLAFLLATQWSFAQKNQAIPNDSLSLEMVAILDSVLLTNGKCLFQKIYQRKIAKKFADGRLFW
ncbi:MAG: hypothetical protein AAGJ18_04205 [Bacteroidota bacterium]